jgi:uncharacterized membrane protein YhhN
VTSPRRAASAGEWALVAVAIAAAVVRGLGPRWGLPPALVLAAKGLTVSPLALLAFARRRTLPGGALLALALAAHVAGDLLLEGVFVAGVAAFFLGHLLYVGLFWRARRALDDVGGGGKLALGLLALATAGLLALLAPRLAGALRAAIPLYAAALAAMAGSALLVRRGRPWVPAGGLLFVASDALLALELFARGGRTSSAWIWPLYVAAQLALTLGWIYGGEEPRREPEPTEEPGVDPAAAHPVAERG